MGFLDRGGVRLAFDDVGEGDRQWALIHGAYADRSAYVEQVAEFAPADRVVTLDMRGHGESDSPPGPYGMDYWAEDVAWMIRRLEMERPILVGHSMGGLVAVEVAARYPDLAAAVITLDSPSLIPGWNTRYPGSYTDAMQGADFRETLKEFLGVAWHPVDSAERRSRAMDLVDKMPEHAIHATWGALREWDPIVALRACKVPFLYIDHGQPDCDLDLVREHCPHVVSGQTVGAGHWALQEVPDQVNGMLRRFVDNAPALSAHALAAAGAFDYSGPSRTEQ